MSVDLARLGAAVEAALMARGGRERGDEIICRCPTPEHADERPSCRYHRTKMAYTCDPCGASGGLLTGDRPIVSLLAIDPDDYQEGGAPPSSSKGGIGTSWEIRNLSGKIVAVHHRRDAPDGTKKVWWTGPSGEKKLTTKTPALPLYGCHLLGDREPGDDTPVFIVEGEKAADTLLALNIPAVGTVTGASSTPGAAPLEVLQCRHVVVWPDNDDIGRRHMDRIAAALKEVVASVRTFAPEGLPTHGDVVEWLEAHDKTADVAGALLAAVEADAVAAGPTQPTPPEFQALDEGHYRLTFPDLGITFTVDRLRRERHQLQGELAVRCELAGARTVDGVLSIGDMNLSSVQARATRAKYLASRAQTADIDWILLLDEFTQRVLAAERAGEPAVMLRDLPRPAPDEALDIDGLQLLARHPLIIFGDGGAAKSYHALYLAGRLDQRGVRVGFFDWELAGEDHRERLELLFGSDMPGIRYARCTRPLVYEIDRLRRIVRDEGLGYVILDSIAFACDGPPEAAEVAGRYFQALRQLGPIGSLHVAHVAKALEGADQKPFGSVFWHNGARATWNVKLAGTTPGDRAITIGLYNRKANLGAKRPAVGFEFAFAPNRTHVRRVDLADVDDLAAALPVAERMRLSLRSGPMSIADLVEQTNATANTIKSNVRRKPKLFVRVPGPDGADVISLVERRAR